LKYKRNVAIRQRHPESRNIVDRSRPLREQQPRGLHLVDQRPEGVAPVADPVLLSVESSAIVFPREGTKKRGSYPKPSRPRPAGRISPSAFRRLRDHPLRERRHRDADERRLPRAWERPQFMEQMRVVRRVGAPPRRTGGTDPGRPPSCSTARPESSAMQRILWAFAYGAPSGGRSPRTSSRSPSAARRPAAPPA